MEEDQADIALSHSTAKLVQGALPDAERFLIGLLRFWNAYLIPIALGLGLAAYLLTRLIGSRLHDRVLTFKPPVCHIVGFGGSSVDHILRFWIEGPTGGPTNIRGNAFLALWDAFKENGISIPFPPREVTLLHGSQIRTETE